MDKKITYGLIGLVSLLAGFGGSLLFTQDQLANTYICTINNEVGVFQWLSSTSKTGYWIENNITYSSVCRNGYWIKLTEYAKITGVPIENLLVKEPVLNIGTVKYRCDQYNCTRIE